MGWRDEESKVHSEVSGLSEDIRGSGTQGVAGADLEQRETVWMSTNSGLVKYIMYIPMTQFLANSFDVWNIQL